MKKFTKALMAKGYSYEYNDDKITVTHDGHVELLGLKKLPANVNFANGGDVYLRDLKKLRANITFTNGGSVDLPSVKKFPKNITFKNGSGVYLHDLQDLPETVRFENGGHVFLHSMRNKTINFNNRTIEVIEVDDWTMIIEEKQTEGDFGLYNAVYLVGTYSAYNTKCTIVEKDGDFAIFNHYGR